MKKKYTALYTVLFIMFAMLAAGCSMFDSIQSSDDSVPSGMCAISVNAGLERSAYPSTLASDNITYYATVSMTSDGATVYLGSTKINTVSDGTIPSDAYLANKNTSASPSFYFYTPAAEGVYTISLYGVLKNSTAITGSDYAKYSIVKGSASLGTLAAGQRKADAVTVALSANYSTSETGKGGVNLSLTMDDALAAKVTEAGQITASLSKNGITSSLTVNVSGSTITLSGTDIASGSHTLTLLFKDGSESTSNVLPTDYTMQSVTVIPGFTTDVWYAADSVASISSLPVNLTTGVIYYVEGTGGTLASQVGAGSITVADTNTGLAVTSPLKTVQAAVNKITTANNNTDTYYIYIDGTVTDSGTSSYTDNNKALVNINPGSVLTLTIASLGTGAVINAARSSSATGRVMYVGSNVTLTLQNVTLAGGYMSGSGTDDGCGGGVYMNGGTLNLQSGAKIGYTAGITSASSSTCSNYASVNGGGIYMAADTGAMVNMNDGAYISYNYCAGNGGGVYLDGTSATNQNTFKMYDGEIAYNTASANGGGLFLMYTSLSKMTGGCIHDNAVNNGFYGCGGGINLSSNASFGMEGGSIYKNSAGNGGGVSIENGNTFTMTGGSISSNTAVGLGKGVKNNDNFIIGGTAVVAADNYVYIADGKYITVKNGYSIPSGYSYGAVIASALGNSIVGTKVLTAESGTLSYAQCNMFALTPVSGETGSTSTLYCIAPNGVIAKAGAGVTTSYDQVLYKVVEETASFICGKSAVMTIQNYNGSVYNGNASCHMELYQNGASTGVMSSDKTLSLPAYLMGGTYQLYMNAKIGNNTYDAWKTVTIYNTSKVPSSDLDKLLKLCTGTSAASPVTIVLSDYPDTATIFTVKTALKNNISVYVVLDLRQCTGDISADGFADCSGITSILLPISTTSIGDNAFKNCTALKTVHVTRYVSATDYTTLGTGSFEGCTALANIYVPSAGVDIYKAAANWSGYAGKISAEQ